MEQNIYRFFYVNYFYYICYIIKLNHFKMNKQIIATHKTTNKKYDLSNGNCSTTDFNGNFLFIDALHRIYSIEETYQCGELEDIALVDITNEFDLIITTINQ